MAEKGTRSTVKRKVGYLASAGSENGVKSGQYVWRRIPRERHMNKFRANVLYVSVVNYTQKALELNFDDGYSSLHLARRYPERFKLSEFWYIGARKSILKEKIV